ncbi:ATP-binding protein [Hugenholtzia roseola]|uniref:ATP-binding protein n=1 Tax=Hugenholtzia roseola TaxID=1002 RepID=UPI00040E1FED|nr:ATP-binding protein [Hugenholtzia roseola]
MTQLPLLSIGEQSFEELRTKGCIYVDKTAFLVQLLFIEQQKFIFLPRPRRFGKSLLISTLKALFLGKKELFAGLYIEDKITWESNPVLHFDFSRIGFNDIGLYQAIELRLEEMAAEYEVSLTKKGIALKFSELIETLHEKTNKKVVILIDEYDKPITDVLEIGENKKAQLHRDILRTFYSVVKGSSAHIRLFFMTGIARFSKISLFSDLNNLTDLSQVDDYHNLLGYTQKELESYFSAHLNYIAEKKNMPLEVLLTEIKGWYNGFSWNGTDKLYNPYSILRFLFAKKFNNYWFDSGTPKFLVELLKKEVMYDVSGVRVTSNYIENVDINNLNLETILFQTGYLTIKKIDRLGRYLLGYPNKEVEKSMLECILEAYVESPRQALAAFDLIEAVETSNFELMKTVFNTLFASIPYQIFDQNQEKYFYAIVFLTFKLCGFHLYSEVSTSLGRIDALLEVDDKVYIFEFKLNESAEIALRQIHERGYYKQFMGQDKKIYLIGINFSSQTKSVAELRFEGVG